MSSRPPFIFGGPIARGPAGAVKIGEVNTVDPDEPADVIDTSDDPTVAVLDFAIPRGEQGLPGVNAVPTAQAVAAYMSETDPDPEDNPVPATLKTLNAEQIVAEVKEKQGRNILDYGVSIGTTEDQSDAILAALAAHPGEPFWFPNAASAEHGLSPYRVDKSLAVTTSNPLIVDGRIYAAAAMDVLLDWDNGAGSVSGYAQDKFIVGRGELDANLLADTALAVGRVIRFPIEGLTITDPVHRGLVTKAQGAELKGHRLRFHNTGTTNSDDNVAIEADMYDCAFFDIVTRDFTIGVWDKAGNDWYDTHPWLGDGTQLAARYEDSVAFKMLKPSRLFAPYADTYRYGIQGVGSGGGLNEAIQVFGLKFLCNDGNLSGALATAHPGAVFDVGGGHKIQSWSGLFDGHASYTFPLVTGDARRFFHRGGAITSGISGFGDYRWGVLLGAQAFTPIIEGSTGTGPNTYSAQEGYIEIREGRAGVGIMLVHFRVICTIASGTTGNLRLGGIPYPAGATSIRPGNGRISYLSGGVPATGLATSSAASGTQQATLFKSDFAVGTSSQVPAPAAGTQVEYHGTIEIPFLFATS